MKHETLQVPIQPAPPGAAGKHLIFRLGGEPYGVPVAQVREIVGNTDVTPLPRMPAHVKGVFNLRGRVTPVLDLRLTLGLPEEKIRESRCTVVAEVMGNDGRLCPTGLMVDDVDEVATLRDDQLEPSPDFGGETRLEHILALARTKNGMVTLLNLQSLIVPAPIPAPTATAAGPPAGSTGPSGI